MSNDERASELLEVWEERAERGEPVTPEELCGDRPDLLPALRQRIQERHDRGTPIDTTRTDGRPGAAPDDEGDPAPPGPRPVRARYRPLRFHAAGGLGEVLVARDEELHREVALKRM